MKTNLPELLGINPELSTYDIPVFEKKLPEGQWGAANMDRTIHINKNLSQKNKKAAVEHEMEHVKQFRSGEATYDNNNIYYRKTPFSPIKKISRYFSLDEWFSKNLESLPEPVQQTFPFMIVPKASKSEKNEGLDNFDTKQVTGGGGGVGDYIDDVNSASGKFGSEKAPSRNIHPTVKPLTLMNYLVVLGSRKGDVVLEPFAGSGTTALACVSQERDYIAIEREEEYYEIAKARLDKLEQPLKMWEKFSG